MSNILQHFATCEVRSAMSIDSMPVKYSKDLDIIVNQYKHVILVQYCLIPFNRLDLDVTID